MAPERGAVSGAPRPPAPRVALTLPEAAEALGVSTDHFRRHVLRDVRVIRCGRLRLVPVRELEAWAERSAALALPDDLDAGTSPEALGARGS